MNDLIKYLDSAVLVSKQDCDGSPKISIPLLETLSRELKDYEVLKNKVADLRDEVINANKDSLSKSEVLQMANNPETCIEVLGHFLKRTSITQPKKFPLAETTIKGPVKFDPFSTLILDNDENIVCDIRGWGNIQYLSKPTKRQDEIGEMIAYLINKQLESSDE